jgi:hypothetical protein
LPVGLLKTASSAYHLLDKLRASPR